MTILNKLLNQVLLTLMLAGLMFHAVPIPAAEPDYVPVEPELIKEQKYQEKAVRMKKKITEEKFQFMVSYKVFTPQNSKLNEVAGTSTGFSLSADIYRYFTLGLDMWENSSPKATGVKELSAQAIYGYAKYPYLLNEYISLYAGLGYRAESLSVNSGDAEYGNNGALVTAGAKLPV